MDDLTELCSVVEAGEEVAREKGFGETLFSRTGLFDLTDAGAESLDVFDLGDNCGRNVLALGLRAEAMPSAAVRQ